MIKTRAAVYTAYGQPLVIDEVELPDPGPDHVLIRQFASGICHSQLHRCTHPRTGAPGIPATSRPASSSPRGVRSRTLPKAIMVFVAWLGDTPRTPSTPLRPAEA